MPLTKFSHVEHENMISFKFPYKNIVENTNVAHFISNLKQEKQESNITYLSLAEHFQLPEIYLIKAFFHFSASKYLR